MALIHIHDTITAIRQPWLGGAYAGRYIQRIQEGLAGKNKLAVGNALSLGNYPGHSQVEKDRRMAIRAVLLAQLTVGGKPLHARNGLYNGLKSRRRDQLVAAFRSGVPWDDRMRLTWAPHNFTDPNGNVGRVLQRKQDWTGRPVPAFRFLIHSLLAGSRLPSTLNILQNPAGVLSGWDAISCSLISETKPFPYGHMGLILRVSERNILTTAATDQNFRNHAGTPASGNAGESTGGLANQLLLAQHIARKHTEFGGLSSPAELLQRQAASPGMTRHSEIVVTGRAGFDFGAKATQPITVPALFRRVDLKGKPYRDTNAIFSSLTLKRNAVDALTNAAQALNIPVLYIPDDSGL